MDDLNSLALPALYARLAAGGLVRRLLELARDEDLGVGGRDESTLASLAANAAGEAALVARAPGVVCGLAALDELFGVFGVRPERTDLVADGERVQKGDRIAVLRGRTRDLLLVERTMVNLVARLSGVSTQTLSFVHAMGTGVRARLYDTRKTTPGLRMLEKYAVRCGGAMAHRLGLWDAVLLKDNHLAGVPPSDLAGFVATAARRARDAAEARGQPLTFVEVEVDSLKQLERLLTLDAGLIDVILLDNMSPNDLRQGVGMRDSSGQPVLLEASGGVRLDSVRLIAETGVDRISAGSLTHAATWLDLALDMAV